MRRETEEMKRRIQERRDESRSAWYRNSIGCREKGQSGGKPEPGQGDEPTEEAKEAQRALNFFSRFW